MANNDIVFGISANYPKGTYVFPSSSAINRGKLLTETNLRNINGLLTTRNYKVEHSDFILNIDDPANLKISSGIAIINGYRVVLPDTLQLGMDEKLESGKTYNINLKISIQQSTSGYIIEEDNPQYGAIYFDATEKTEDDTLENKIDSTYDDINGYYLRDYKPAVNRFNVKNDAIEPQIILDKNFSDNFIDNTVPVTSDSNFKFTALNWMADRDRALFVSAWGTNEANLNDLQFNASRLNKNPTFMLTLGSITVYEVSGVKSYSVTTYDCTKRIDASDIYIGEQTLEEYLACSGTLLKSYGKNIISSIRNFEDDNSTGTLKEVPYIGTVDSAYFKNENVYDTDLMYVPITYMGESRIESIIPIDNFDSKISTYFYKDSDNYIPIFGVVTEESFEEYKTQYTTLYVITLKNDGKDISELQSIIECAFNSVPQNELNEGTCGSQVLSVASITDCYTSYGYNVINRDVDVDDNNNQTFVSKKAKLNKYYIGIDSPTSYVGLSGDSKLAPPFGIYDKDKNVFFGIKNQYDGNESKYVLYGKSNGTNIILTSYATEVTTGNNFDASSYDIGDIVKYNGTFYGCKTAHTVVSHDSSLYRKIIDEAEFQTIISSPNSRTAYNSSFQPTSTFDADNTYVETNPTLDTNLWEISYFSVANTFETEDTKSTFKVYSDNIVNSYVGFINDNDKAKIVLSDGTNESYIHLEGTESSDDPNIDGTPIVKFDNNARFNGYVRANRVYNAVYNDYAEWYKSSNANEITEGDIIYYDPINDEYSNCSTVAKRVVGICSEDYGFIVGGNDTKNITDNRKDHIPVSLCGRVKVKVSNNCDFECGDYVYANGTNVGVNVGSSNEIVGKFLKYIDSNFALVQVQLA